jgi:hypothetical protein
MLDGGERGKGCFKLSGNRLSILSRVRRVVGSGSVCGLQLERIEFVCGGTLMLSRVCGCQIYKSDYTQCIKR